MAAAVREHAPHVYTMQGHVCAFLLICKLTISFVAGAIGAPAATSAPTTPLRRDAQPREKRGRQRRGRGRRSFHLAVPAARGHVVERQPVRGRERERLASDAAGGVCGRRDIRRFAQ